jgi:hypothetical protein
MKIKRKVETGVPIANRKQKAAAGLKISVNRLAARKVKPPVAAAK